MSPLHQHQKSERPIGDRSAYNEGLSREDRKPPLGTCGARHPLLDEARCQRLQGHPGAHGAYLDAAAADMSVNWHDEEERAG